MTDEPTDPSTRAGARPAGRRRHPAAAARILTLGATAGGCLALIGAIGAHAESVQAAKNAAQAADNHPGPTAEVTTTTTALRDTLDATTTTAPPPVQVIIVRRSPGGAAVTPSTPGASPRVDRSTRSAAPRTAGGAAAPTNPPAAPATATPAPAPPRAAAPPPVSKPAPVTSTRMS